ncbi:MAG: hypothetical protein ACRYFR_08335 [Janthinobacterium lividum]
MKIRFSFLLLTAVLLGAAPTPRQLVVPGRSLGQVQLGLAPAGAHLPTTPPNASDAAMGKAWATWYGARPAHGAPTELDVYTAPPPGDDGSHRSVQVVRATSPYFQLANGLHAGSNLRSIRAAYGALPLATTYSVPGGVRYLYDAGARGIAFETSGKALDSKCTAVVVHLPKLAAKKFYVSMGQYLHNRTKPR